MTAKNDITGDSIISKANTKAYNDNYDRIFGDTRPKRGSYIQDKETGKLISAQEWYEKYGQERGEAPFIITDIPAYQSPITGKMITSRKERAEDLKRSGSRPYEGFEAEKKEADRIRAENDQKFESKIPDMLQKTANDIKYGNTKPCKDPLIF